AMISLACSTQTSQICPSIPAIRISASFLSRPQNEQRKLSVLIFIRVLFSIAKDTAKRATTHFCARGRGLHPRGRIPWPRRRSSTYRGHNRVRWSRNPVRYGGSALRTTPHAFPYSVCNRSPFPRTGPAFHPKADGSSPANGVGRSVCLFSLP